MTTTAPLVPKIWYSANCHCGALRYRVSIPPLWNTPNPHKVMRCNCSLCTRNGYLNVYPLRNEIRVQLGSVEVAPGSAALRKEIDLGYYTPKGAGEGSEHVFCVKCGSSVWVDRLGGEEGKAVDGEEDFVALNVRLSIRAVLNEPSMQKVRMLKDIDVGELVFEFANGKSWEPQYQI